MQLKHGLFHELQEEVQSQELQEGHIPTTQYYQKLIWKNKEDYILYEWLNEIFFVPQKKKKKKLDTEKTDKHTNGFFSRRHEYDNNPK